MKTLSYNLYFENLELEKRIGAFCELVQKVNPDVICIQEVTKSFLVMISNASWFSQYQCIFPIFKKTNKEITTSEIVLATSKSQIKEHLNSLNWYFVAILSKHKIVDHLYKPFENSKMGRGLLAVNIELPFQSNTPGSHVSNIKFCVATSHLESPPMNSEKRIQQLAESLNILKDLSNDSKGCLLMGDMNWTLGDGTPNLPEDWSDLWLDLHSSDPGFTFDYTKNNLVKNFQTRIDRVFANLGNGAETKNLFACKAIEIVGTEPIEPKLYISDHFGLLCTFESDSGVIKEKGASCLVM